MDYGTARERGLGSLPPVALSLRRGRCHAARAGLTSFQNGVRKIERRSDWRVRCICSSFTSFRVTAGDGAMRARGSKPAPAFVGRQEASRTRNWGTDGKFP